MSGLCRLSFQRQFSSAESLSRGDRCARQGVLYFALTTLNILIVSGSLVYLTYLHFLGYKDFCRKDSAAIGETLKKKRALVKEAAAARKRRQDMGFMVRSTPRSRQPLDL